MFDLIEACQLFQSRALVIRNDIRSWGLHEIISIQNSDDGLKYYGLWPTSFDDDMNWSAVPAEDIIAIIPPSENVWVEEEVSCAFSHYLESAKTQSDWDRFSVTVRLLV